MNTLSEEYYRRYEELQSLLERAYVDIYALQEIEKYNAFVQNDGYALPKSSFNVLRHISELLKVDLGLTVWKISIDNNQKANTIQHLSNYIRSSCANLVDVNHLPKTSFPKGLKNTANQLNTIRKNHLAHNDSEKQSVVIKISEIADMAEHLKTVLNGLCFSNIDKRAMMITDQDLRIIRNNVSLGLGMMIYRNTFPIKFKGENSDNSLD